MIAAREVRDVACRRVALHSCTRDAETARQSFDVAWYLWERSSHWQL